MPHTGALRPIFIGVVPGQRRSGDICFLGTGTERTILVSSRHLTCWSVRPCWSSVLGITSQVSWYAVCTGPGGLKIRRGRRIARVVRVINVAVSGKKSRKQRNKRDKEKVASITVEL